MQRLKTPHAQTTRQAATCVSYTQHQDCFTEKSQLQTAVAWARKHVPSFPGSHLNQRAGQAGHACELALPGQAEVIAALNPSQSRPDITVMNMERPGMLTLCIRHPDGHNHHSPDTQFPKMCA